MGVFRDLSSKGILKTVNRSLGKVGSGTSFLSQAWSELLMAAVPASERQEFITNSYQNQSWYFSNPEGAKLFDWEANAIEEFFPTAPAKILVGGCGGGREANVLIQKGYEVAAFDPCPSLVAHLKNIQKDPRLLTVANARYKNLAQGLDEFEKHAPYDAIILGWLSMSHILQKEVRVELFKTLRKLAPDGPVLLSWVSKKSVKTNTKRKQLRLSLRKAGFSNYQQDETFCNDKGFTHLYSTKELFQLAEKSGYIFQVLKGSTPHGIMWPRK